MWAEMKRRITQTGSTVYGFHEGTRSEYFAQCVFSAFGTSVPVPHPEDHGIDFYCTLTERIAQRLWARASYTVQVKSEHTWVLESRESVEWLIKHPLPLFLGVMDKKTLTLRIYHTAPRCYVWALGDLPTKLEMTMTDETTGQSTEWGGDYKFRLAPILCIKMTELASNDDYTRNARDVLEHWIEVENRNLTRIRTGIYGWEMPEKYQVNVLPHAGGTSAQWLARPSEELMNNGLRNLSECLEVLGTQLHNTGKFVAAVECALLHRYLNKNSTLFTDKRKARGGRLFDVRAALSKLLGKNRSEFASVDELQRLLEEATSQRQ
jgi:hypothetical protein